jgi:hypothetical protein
VVVQPAERPGRLFGIGPRNKLTLQVILE